MAQIIVDQDTILRFGHTYDRIGDATESHRRVLRFDEGSLDRQLSAFGVRLRASNANWSSVAEAVRDVDARIQRVATHLHRSSGVLFRHATDVASADDFDWRSILGNALRDSARDLKDELFGSIEQAFDVFDIPGYATRLAGEGGALAGVVGGLSTSLTFVNLVDDIGDMHEGEPATSEWVVWAEWGGDIAKVGSGLASVALMAAGLPVAPWLVAAGVLGWGTDLVFENWEGVNDAWDTATSAVGDFVSDIATDVLTTAGDIWDTTVEFSGSVVAGFDFLFNQTTDSTLHGAEEITAALREAENHVPTAINSLQLTAGGLDRTYKLNNRLVASSAALLQQALGGTTAIGRLKWLEQQQILHIDPRTGHAILVSGDLASASRVIVAVPGTGVSLGNIDGFAEPLNQLQPSMGSDTAIVTWLDYSTPKDLIDASYMEDEFATSVAPLAGFLRQIQAPGRNVVLFGHSAGARVVQNQVTDTNTSDFVDGVILSGTPDLAEEFPAAMGSRPTLLLNHTLDPIPALSLKGALSDAWNSPAFNLRVRDREGPLGLPAAAHGFGSYVEDFGTDINGFTRAL